MAENGRQNGEIVQHQMPVTPAPTRSQTNLASRAQGIEKIPVDIAGRGTLQVWDKPPPGEPEKSGRRSTDAAAVSRELRDNASFGQPEGGETRAENPRSWKPTSLAAQALLAMLCIITGMFAPAGRKRVRQAPAPQSRVQTAKSGMAPAEQVRSGDGLPADSDRALTTALDDLDNALEQRAESPEQILKRVSGPGEDCMLAWRGDYPSLVFGKKMGPDSIAATLEGCARAVARLPP